MGIKSDIIQILKPKFGNNIEKIIEEHYTDDDFAELYDLAYHMLKAFMEKETVESLLNHLISKYPQLKK